MVKKPELRIGEVSRLTRVSIETVRYYEKIGLLPEPQRTAAGHRVYLSDHLKRLTFIRRGRGMGFTLDDIRNLLGLVDGGYTCGKMKAAALGHLDDIRRKIADLRRIEQALDETVAQCEGGAAPECPVVEVLSGHVSRTASPR